MRVLLTAPFWGGPGGMERCIYSMAKALEDVDVTVAATRFSTGPFSEIASGASVLRPWRWRAGSTIKESSPSLDRLFNKPRGWLNRRFDLHFAIRGIPNLIPTTRSGVRLVSPGGSREFNRLAGFDYFAMQAPDNQFLYSGLIPSILLPPPVFDLSEHAQRIRGLPDEFILTVFNAYSPAKGLDALRELVTAAPVPVVWCTSSTLETLRDFEHLKRLQSLIIVRNPSPSEIRYLYEQCFAYVSLSSSEGFGWAVADALRYSPRIVSHPIGVLSFDSLRTDFVDYETFSSVAWSGLPRVSDQGRSLELCSPTRFRETLLSLVS